MAGGWPKLKVDNRMGVMGEGEVWRNRMMSWLRVDFSQDAAKFIRTGQ